MAIIKTYPLKSTYYSQDKFLISDMQPDSEGNVSGDTKNITFSTLKTLISGGSLTLTTTGTSGASTFDVNTNTLNVPVYTGDTYTLQAESKSGTSVPLKLDASTGTDSTVSLTEGANITLTRNSATQITIASSGGSSGVSSFTNAFGTYITGTTNSAATGAVGLGTIDLNAADGTSIATTRFLSKDNTWDIISPAGSNTQFQYNNSGAFGATSLMVFTSNDEIQIGQQTTEQGKLIVSGQAAGTSGLIKIEGKSTRGITFSVQPEINVNYNVIFPETGPGGNDKILQSNSSGELAWIDTPSSSATPASITGTTAVNTTTFANTPYTFASTSTSSGSGAPFATQVNGSAGNKHIAFYYQTTLCGSISQNGSSAVAYNTSSDYRLKENVVDMTGSVDRLKQLKPSRFNFITDGPSRTVDGFIAHEVSSIVPEAITGIKDAVDAEDNIIPQGIDQSKLVPLLVGAIKELTARIEALEA